MNNITPLIAGIDVRNRSNGQTWIIVHDLELGSIRFPLPDDSCPRTTADAVQTALIHARYLADLARGLNPFPHPFPTLLRPLAERHDFRIGYLEQLANRKTA